MLEDAVSENFVHDQYYISVSTPNKTEDKILLWRTNVMIVRTLLTWVPASLSHSSPTCPPPWAGWAGVSLPAPHQATCPQECLLRYSRALLSTAVSASNTAKRKPEVSGRANKKTVLSRSLSLSPESLLLFRIWTCSRLGWTMILGRTRGLRGCCKQLWTSYCVKNCVFLLFTMSWYFQIFWWSSQFIRKQGRMRTMQSKVPRRKVPHPRQKRARHCSW